MSFAVAAPVAETLLMESVAAPAALEGMSLAGAEFGVPSLFGGSSGLGALGGAAGELGGLGGLLGGGVSSAGTGLGAGALQGGLGSIAPEAFAQTQAALQATIPGANQIAAASQLPFEISPAELQAAQGVVSEAAPAATSSYFPQPVSPIPGYATEPAVDAISNVAQNMQTPNEFLHSKAGYGDYYDNRFNPLEAPSGGGLGDLGNMLKNGLGSVGKFIDENPKTSAAAAGLGGYLLGQKKNAGAPEVGKYSGPLSRFQYDPSKYTPTIAQPPTNPYRAQYTSYAKGGIADLGGYSDGGQMLKGPGDGMSDSIPANIANKQPARLANEEFVIPADVVSHLGNGSSDAGAKQLYSMMDRVRKARTGTKKQGRQISPNKYMPA
jgi:hypothetical protein